MATPANDARFHLDKPFEHGHFAHVGPNYRYRVSRFDAANREFWLPGGFFFQIADFDWALASDWCWDCGDDFTVYEDPDHPGWYLVYNVQTGAYVHAQYMGGYQIEQWLKIKTRLASFGFASRILIYALPNPLDKFDHDDFGCGADPNRRTPGARSV